MLAQLLNKYLRSNVQSNALAVVGRHGRIFQPYAGGGGLLRAQMNIFTDKLADAYAAHNLSFDRSKSIFSNGAVESATTGNFDRCAMEMSNFLQDSLKDVLASSNTFIPDPWVRDIKLPDGKSILIAIINGQSQEWYGTKQATDAFDFLLEAQLGTFENCTRFLDLGGHHFVWAVYYALRNADAKVVSVEPSILNVAIGLFNCLVNNVIERVDAIPFAVAVGDEEKDDSCKMLVDFLKVPLRTRHLDKFVQGHFDFIKVDIEGYEYELLNDKTFIDLVKNANATHFELHLGHLVHRNIVLADCVMALKRDGFSGVELYSQNDMYDFLKSCDPKGFHAFVINGRAGVVKNKPVLVGGVSVNMTGQASDPYYANLEGFAVGANVLHKFVKRNIVTNGVILDVGANIGLTTIAMTLAAPNCSVVSFEPGLINANFFETNIKAAKLKNVELLRLGIGDKKGEARFYTASTGANSHIVTGEHQLANNPGFLTTSIPVTTLDDLMSEGKISGPIALIKIDVEGFEPNVLAGAAELIEKYNPLIYIEFNTVTLTVAQGYSPMAFARALFEYYEVMSVDADGVLTILSDPAQLVHDNIIHHGSVEDIVLRSRKSSARPTVEEMTLPLAAHAELVELRKTVSNKGSS